jgi:ACS family glucarate transporter-like MFS transporter
MTSLGLDKIQMGQVFSAFMLGYAVFQVPWGMSGDRLGPGRTLTWAAVVWVATTALTGFAPGLLVPAGALSLAILMVLRFLLGVGEAAAYPLAARAIASSMPITERAASFSALIVGMAIGSAFTPPLVSWAMVNLGWRTSFYVCALPPLALAVWWHRATSSSPDTLQALRDPEARGARQESGGVWSSLSVLKDRNIAWLSVSYFFDGYVLFVFVFWLFLYLLEERGMTVMSSGRYAALPYIAGMILAPAAGILCDRLVPRWGHVWARRSVAMVSLALSAAFLFVGVDAASPVTAIVGLSLAVGFLLCTEGAYWSMSMDLGGPRAGTAGGVLNLAGNLGGVVSTSLVPVLVKYFGWPFAFQSAAALAAIAAVLWLLVKVESPDGRPA